MTFHDAFQLVPPLIGLGLIAVGLLLAYFGRLLFYILLFIVGGAILGLIAFSYGLLRNGGDMNAGVLWGIGGFVFGGILALFFFFLVVVVLGAIAGWLLAIAYFPGDNVALAILVIGIAILAVILLYLALALVTAIMGGLLMTNGLVALGIPLELSILVAAILALLGLIFQVRGPLRDREPYNPVEAMG